MKHCAHTRKRWLRWGGSIAGWECVRCGHRPPTLLRYDHEEA